MSEIYERFYYFYMENMASIETLNKLAEAGKLTQLEVDNMVSDRLERKGF